MKFITIDFETYYDKDYSLSKMQTDAYVMDERFQVIGVGIKIGDEPAFWVHDGMDGHIVKVYLDRIDWSDAAVICHNTMFDGYILTHRFGVRPRLWMDTLAMARMLYPWERSFSLASVAKFMDMPTEKGTEVADYLGYRLDMFNPTELNRYGAYCMNDVELTYGIAMKFLAQTPPLELKLIDMTVRMFTEPKLIGDIPQMESLHAAEVSRKLFLLDEAGISKDVVMSNDKLATELANRGVPPPMKISARTGRPAYAFAKSDKEFAELLEHDDPDVQALVAARLGVKTTIAETRALRFLETARRGPLPVYLQFWGAKTTGRYSGGNQINWQNIPARGPSAGLRKAIAAPEGSKVVVGDSSNIELRIAMVAAGQDDVVEMIRNGEDLYCNFASKLFGRVITKADATERQIGKVAMLGLQYGMGWAKFKETVRIQAGQNLAEDSARQTVDLYRTVHGRIVRLWDYLDKEILPEIYNNGGSELLPVDVNAWCITSNFGFGLHGQPGVVYKDLRRDTADANQWVYRMGREDSVKIYGGKCIDGNALVLTERGWKPLSQLEQERVHDGVEFVSHGGKVLKGVQECVTVDGVYMTPTHKVLTDEGWLPALEKPEPYRPTIRNAHCDTAEPLGRKKNALAFSVYLRSTMREGRGGCDEGSAAGWDSKLRLHDAPLDVCQTGHAPHEQASGVCRVAKHVRQMQTALASRVEKLRSAWDKRMSRVGSVLRELLARHGAELSPWAYARSCGQQSGVQYSQLRMENAQATSSEQAEQPRYRHSIAIGADGHTEVNAVLSTGAGASTRRQVWDILNCGPRSRFVILGENGPFIVHNCMENLIQHLARHVVMWQTARINERYPVALSVHDEVVCVVSDEEVPDAVKYITECLSLAPPWCGDLLPLSCSVGVGQTYGDAK